MFNLLMYYSFMRMLWQICLYRLQLTFDVMGPKWRMDPSSRADWEELFPFKSGPYGPFFHIVSMKVISWNVQILGGPQSMWFKGQMSQKLKCALVRGQIDLFMLYGAPFVWEQDWEMWPLIVWARSDFVVNTIWHSQSPRRCMYCYYGIIRVSDWGQRHHNAYGWLCAW